MGYYAPDGSVNIELDAEGYGRFSADGYLRCTTAESNAGVNAPDGSFYVVVDPETGRGVYDASTGAYRISTDSGKGIYSDTGAMRVTITNPPEEV